MPVINADKLKALSVRIFEAVGVHADVAERVSSHLVESNLAGMDSHGVMRLAGYIEWVKAGSVAPDNRVEVLQDKGATVLLDAHSTFGPVAAAGASDIAVNKARQFGIGLVTARDSSHIGRLGEYADQIARQGFIGFICANLQGGGQLVAPWGGREARLSTNPMAWGIPTGADPIILDCATSASSEGKVRIKMRTGQKIPSTWALDAAGNAVTNPADFYGPPMGALLGAGGFKGYGLAIMFEALAGALSAGGCVQAPESVRLALQAFTVIAIDIETFLPLAGFTGMMDGMVDYLKSSAPQDPNGEILVPNDPEIRERQRRSANGIPIDDDTWQTIEDTARNLGVEIPALS